MSPLEHDVSLTIRQPFYVEIPAGLVADMRKEVYDTDGDGIVDYAENVSDGTNTTTAEEVRKYVDWIIERFTETYRIQVVNSDLWITANAYYDEQTQTWNRIDEDKFAFGIQIQGFGNIPGEPVQGITIWRAVPGDNPIGDFATYGGWELAFTITAFATGVLGGVNFEIDGSGTISGYGRINQLEDGTYISRNAYWDGQAWKSDNPNYPATAVKIGNNSVISILFAQASQNPSWEEKITLYQDGKIRISALTNGSYNIVIDDIKQAVDWRHQRNNDTALAPLSANINMNNYQLTNLGAPSANGNAIRRTDYITEENLERAVIRTPEYINEYGAFRITF